MSKQVNVKLSKTATHKPRTAYNAAMWDAIANCPNIEKGVEFGALVAHCMEAVPQSQHHAHAHVKYLLRSKGALELS